MRIFRRLNMITEISKGHALPPSSFEFKRVDERSSLFPVVKTIFENDLKPIFGNQTEILTKIAKESNRRCEVLTSGDAPLGLIVWKRAHEKDDSLIVPTVHVINPKVNSVPVIGEALIDRLMKCAQRNSAKQVHVTVAQSDSELLAVFERKNFSLIKTTQVTSTEKYKCLLSCDVAEKKSDQSISSIEANTLRSETSAVPLIPKKKREREETAPSSAILPIDGSEQTQRDDSRDSSRKRHAVEDSSGDRSGNYPRLKSYFLSKCS